MGAKDLYWHMAEIPADQLSDEEKKFILDRFFDTNREISGSSAIEELLALLTTHPTRCHAYTQQDYRDLHV